MLSASSESSGHRTHPKHEHPIVRGDEERLARCLSCDRTTCSPFVSSESDLNTGGIRYDDSEDNMRNLCFACWEVISVDVYVSHAWADRAPRSKAAALRSFLLVQSLEQ